MASSARLFLAKHDFKGSPSSTGNSYNIMDLYLIGTSGSEKNLKKKEMP